MKAMLFATAAALLPVTAMAQSVMAVHDAYARSANPKSGAAFMVLENTGETSCRLQAATSDASQVTELHTHKEVDGVMQMIEVKEGFEIAPGSSYLLQRGGDHVMLMGLNAPLTDGETVLIGLDFGDCGMVEVEVPVDNQRKPDQAAMDGQMHGHMGHSH